LGFGPNERSPPSSSPLHKYQQDGTATTLIPSQGTKKLINVMTCLLTNIICTLQDHQSALINNSEQTGNYIYHILYNDKAQSYARQTVSVCSVWFL
jgi:hypothetical protein